MEKEIVHYTWRAREKLPTILPHLATNILKGKQITNEQTDELELEHDDFLETKDTREICLSIFYIRYFRCTRPLLSYRATIAHVLSESSFPERTAVRATRIVLASATEAMRHRRRASRNRPRSSTTSRATHTGLGDRGRRSRTALRDSGRRRRAPVGGSVANAGAHADHGQ